MERSEINVINPEIPETPEGRLALLRLCIDALAKGGTVEGVTPHHVSLEGLQMLKQLQGDAPAQSGL